MQENFSLSDLNPMNKIKEIGMFLLKILIKTVAIGMIIYFVMSKTGLADQASIKNYILYFLAGSVVMFALTFGYFAFLCRKDKFDAKKLAKLSILGPSIITAHVIVLFVSALLIDIPEIGIIQKMIIWSSFGVVLISGIMYTIGLAVAEKEAGCGSLF